MDAVITGVAATRHYLREDIVSRPGIAKSPNPVPRAKCAFVYEVAEW
jgi:hypothetical protein